MSADNLFVLLYKKNQSLFFFISDFHGVQKQTVDCIQSYPSGVFLDTKVFIFTSDEYQLSVSVIINNKFCKKKKKTHTTPY